MKCATALYLLGLAVIVSLGCGLPTIGQRGPVDAPDNAARKWFQAFADYDGLKLDDLTCSAHQPELRDQTAMATAFGILSERLLGQKAKIDISKLRFATLNIQNDTANVQVTGE